jgi:hypothetical protein
MNERIIALGQWLSEFPYENLTKHNEGSPRDPQQIRTARENLGAGGTCFSLVNLAAYKAEKDYGLFPRYYLGDRPRGKNRHCVLGFPAEGVFLDPGYLCFDPLPLKPKNTVRYQRPQNILQLDPVEDGKVKVQTERKGQLTWRYTLKTEPIGRERFERAWEDSFNWESFRQSNVMTRQRDQDMLLYLNGRLESISRDERSIITPPSDNSDAKVLSELFGVHRELIEEADLTIHTNS